ncbi:HlyD family efflux transporter periplasmic adaptor subunit [Flavobacterium sp. Fl-77]|uniref:HlyD family efflux transporter periplasmic adaptor subunit n=1 Tax=Flavobacterium flavipigmentatum TaxID=2893884 RepID=A0AAJ2SDC3_9FLAO|nr:MULTISPECIES: HlyD family efflux transporter periplasmic adaptor subunit [unclassified Flavobacterium]MDX6181204.1 HlyD family efflux transporter periplasmic adaptor subunit [Flavobacterium sp. Fl-33]MDX6184805.1 HlyD family efflux transporter periplasmic adaptor subunit [Flavobacterium sp. Fl-77]UFH39902.1 HlyD family secretion protein [Flavobacterium sp. F-70]
MTEDTTFELRSEEVQDILTKVPHWMIRWGSVLILGILLMLFFISWFVKYPDVVTAEITITTNVPPEKIVAKASGRIEAILVKNKAVVSKNTTLAIIENTANYKDVFLLKSIIEKYNINDPKVAFPFLLLKNTQLGEIESAYAVFQKEYQAQELNHNLHPFEVESRAQSSENIQIKERLEILQQQKIINESELQLQKNEVTRFETLFNKGIISTQEMEAKKLSYLQAQKSYKSLLSSISQLKSSLIDNTKSSQNLQINSTREEVNLGRNMTQSFYQLKKVIKDWELNYTLQSSVNGVVTFLQVWNENQTINVGDNVFSIIPDARNGFVGKVKAPALNSGKIKSGQKVNIRLANFPDREFGVLKGTIQNIALVPDKEGNLLIDVALPNGLKTSYKKQIIFQQEMKGSAEIVTEDLRLIERILYQFKSVFEQV